MDLTGFSKAQLQRLLEAVQSGAVAVPLTATGLRANGLEQFVDSALCAIADGAALAALLRAVLSEREQMLPHRPTLVWTGPDVNQSGTRDTGVVVRELFESAQKSVLIGGYSFTRSKKILEPLHVAMRDRDVEVEMYIDVDTKPTHLERIEGHLSLFADKFFKDNWPWGDPKPKLFYDPRTVESKYHTLHAKCLVVDEERVFLGSANFTNRGHTRNIEIGLLLNDPITAQALTHQWRQAVTAGQLRAL